MKRFLSVYILCFCCSILEFSACKDLGVLDPEADFDLTVLDVGISDVWFLVTARDFTGHTQLHFFRDGVAIQSYPMTTAQDLTLDSHLAPRHTYRYQVIRDATPRGSNIADVWVTTLDSTSHDFAWQVDHLGEAETSSLRDVVILSDTLAYAVGAIYQLDSLGRQWDPQPYNLARWNGRTWELLRVPTYAACGNPSLYAFPMQAIWAFSAQDIWLAGGDRVAHFNGDVTDLSICLPVSIDIRALWGPSAGSLYAVGSQGAIVHFDGRTWTRLESGTTVDLRDVWGSPDGSQVWACGYTGAYTASVLVEKHGERFVPRFSPLDDLIGSVWSAGPGSFVYTGNGWVRRSLRVDLGQGWTALQLYLGAFAYRIRGAGRDDLACAGDFGMLWHYNGSSWRSYPEVAGTNRFFYGLAMSAHQLMAVGIDYGGSFPTAIVVRGRR